MDFTRPLAVVTPTLDGDVLVVLARAKAAFTGREVHRLVGHASQQGVRKALGRLARQGVVLVEQVGSAYLYRLNQRHLAAPYIEGLAHLRQELYAKLGAEIAGWSVPPTYAAVFGSVATGEAHSDSDLDLFVVRPAGLPSDDPSWVEELSALTERASAWTGNDARVLEYGEEELTLLGGEPVLADVSRAGVTLAGDPQMLHSIRRGRRAR